jgi:hypothetical protein
MGVTISDKEDTGRMTIFDEATAVTRRADGRYDALPDARFAIVAPGGSAGTNVGGPAAAPVRSLMPRRRWR